MANIRVSDLAKALEVPTIVLISYLARRGQVVKSGASTLPPDVADDVRSGFAAELNSEPVRQPRRSTNLQARAEHDRRVIVVLSRDERPNEDWSHVAVASPPARPPRASLDLDLYKRGLLQLNRILVQSPFDVDLYQPLERARELFALDKLLIYDRVAGILGASSFSVEELLVHQGDREFSLKANGTHPVAEVEGSFEREAKENFRRLLEVGSKNFPGEPDLSKAEALVAEKRLNHDPAMNYLLGMVRDGVHKRSHTLRLNLTEEASRNLQIGAKVQSTIALNGGVAADSAYKSMHDLKILLRVEFDR